jgi:hypothetical protein
MSSFCKQTRVNFKNITYPVFDFYLKIVRNSLLKSIMTLKIEIGKRKQVQNTRTLIMSRKGQSITLSVSERDKAELEAIFHPLRKNQCP